MQKGKILIVDDSEMNRSILADMLCDEYEVVEAEDGAQAVVLLQKKRQEFSLVLLDIVMPKLDGFGVLEAMNRNGWIEDVPVIIISSETSPAQVERAYNLGATDFIIRPFDAPIVRRRVLNTLLLYAKQKRLIGMVEEQVYARERQSDLMIDILSHIMEFRNGESGLHILHVRTLTDLMLSCLVKKTGRYNLTMDDISIISTASALHDIGKMAIDDKILNKPGKLTVEEFEIMKTHSARGAEMISDLPVYQDEPLVRVAYQICRWHHERYDGRGYPDGLKGDEIPIAAQVVAIADVYDALTSQRVYKPPFTHEQAIRMIEDGECGAFNPLLLEILSENVERVRTALERDATTDIRERKLKSLSQETLKGVGGGASERTLRLLDRERMRNSFYASMTEAIQFEYTVSPAMVTLSAWGAKKLGLEELIMDPLHSERLLAVIGDETCKRLSGLLRATTPAQPEVRFDCLLSYGGAKRWHRVVCRALWSDEGEPAFEGAFGAVTDIHDAHQRMQELEQRASRDPLTGLLNRESAREQIELRMQEHAQSNFALVLFDLDYFKSANDAYGHQFGDKVLMHAANRLRQSIRGTDISSRIGGDEFLIFLEYRTDIEKTVRRIFGSLCGEVGSFRISVSMGAVLAADVGLSYEKMFAAADSAMYAAKHAGKGRYCFYDKSMQDTLQDAFSDMSAIEPSGGDAGRG